MLIPLDDYRTIGGMDERYFLHVEDLDLCFTIARAGGTVLFVPQVSIVHYKSTSNASAMWIEWYKARGFTQYFRKNFTGLYPRACYSLKSFLIQSKVAARQRTPMKDLAVFS